MYVIGPCQHWLTVPLDGLMPLRAGLSGRVSTRIIRQQMLLSGKVHSRTWLRSVLCLTLKSTFRLFSVENPQAYRMTGLPLKEEAWLSRLRRRPAHGRTFVNQSVC